MKKYLIFMDVSGDLDMEVARKNNVHLIQMDYSLKAEMLTCSGAESEEAIKRFYDAQRKGDLTKTSQISPFAFQEYFSPYMKQGYSILYFCLSSGLSSTYESALKAKNDLEADYPEAKLYVVDTLSATGGMGVLCERAIRNRDAGMSIEDNFNEVVKARENVKCWFMVQDLMYLKRGGRVSASTAVIGTLVGIKPILRIAPNGKLETIAKKRGNQSAISELFERFKASYSDMYHDDVIYIVNADAKEHAEKLAQLISTRCPTVTLRHRSLSPIIGAHTGPGMVAVCHMGRKDTL